MSRLTLGESLAKALDEKEKRVVETRKITEKEVIEAANKHRKEVEEDIFTRRW